MDDVVVAEDLANRAGIEALAERLDDLRFAGHVVDESRQYALETLPDHFAAFEDGGFGAGEAKRRAVGAACVEGGEAVDDVVAELAVAADWMVAGARGVDRR